jgi:hypothetical protein
MLTKQWKMDKQPAPPDVHRYCLDDHIVTLGAHQEDGSSKQTSSL